MRFMATEISVDKRGRIVLPKSLRGKMRMEPRDNLVVEAEGDRFILRPIRPEALLKKEYGVWVYQGDPSGISSAELIDAFILKAFAAMAMRRMPRGAALDFNDCIPDH
jgi:AbrB family looped-hinge helix DNA binding protein